MANRKTRLTISRFERAILNKTAVKKYDWFMSEALTSLQSFYSKKQLKDYSKELVDHYLYFQNYEYLLSLFKKIFGMAGSYFSITDPKKTISELASKYYKNEAIIKSSFIKSELLKGNHVTFYELPIHNSRTDLCMINGQSYAYEIKTEFDTLNRLSKQLDDYLQAFENVYVVCSKEKLKGVLPLIQPEVGVFTYDPSTRKPTFIEVKKGSLSMAINPAVQFEVLSERSKRKLKSKEEFLSKGEWKQLVNQAFKDELKARYIDNWQFLKKNMSRIYPLDWQPCFKAKGIL